LRTSAGLLIYRQRDAGLEVLLAHPGGPFFRNKDEGAWTIPKGEISDGEDLLTRAKIEFAEELGIQPPSGEPVELGSIKQKGGKIVHAWAMKGDVEDDFEPVSNSFFIEWPPGSLKMSEFPEIDRAAFFALPMARWKINPAQIPFLDRLIELLSRRE
jgi:predicted NUDIX family NTP pyrophosphohydrolase